MLSVASEISITSPKPEITDFQIRRRRVAKLTQFFGVDYRELINDVLESIENGLEHERKRGTLRAEEVEDLLERLRALRVKREGVF
jgi:predicted secreted protein